MKDVKTLIPIGLLLIVMAMALSCADEGSKSEEEKYPAVLIGKPAGIGGAGEDNDSVAVVMNVDGEYVMVVFGWTGNRGVAKAKALLQSEKDDGDDEPAVLKGYYDGTGTGRQFIIQYVKANGLEVVF